MKTQNNVSAFYTFRKMREKLRHAFVRGNKEIGGWGPDEPEGQLPLPDSEITLAELLKS